jgi:long-chain acyl-CoA synthetase
VRDLLEEASSAARADVPAGDVRDQLADPEAQLGEAERRWIAGRRWPVRALGASPFGLARLLIPAFFRLQVHSLEHLAGGEPLVITATHLSYLDAPVLVAAPPRARLGRVWWGGWTGIMFASAAIVREIMTANPVWLPETTSVAEAARRMRDASIGGVIVLDGGRITGIVTDRDIVVRGLAEGRIPRTRAWPTSAAASRPRSPRPTRSTRPSAS